MFVLLVLFHLSILIANAGPQFIGQEKERNCLQHSNRFIVDGEYRLFDDCTRHINGTGFFNFFDQKKHYGRPWLCHRQNASDKDVGNIDSSGSRMPEIIFQNLNIHALKLCYEFMLSVEYANVGDQVKNSSLQQTNSGMPLLQIAIQWNNNNSLNCPMLIPNEKIFYTENGNASSHFRVFIDIEGVDLQNSQDPVLSVKFLADPQQQDVGGTITTICLSQPSDDEADCHRQQSLFLREHPIDDMDDDDDDDQQQKQQEWKEKHTVFREKNVIDKEGQRHEYASYCWAKAIPKFTLIKNW